MPKRAGCFETSIGLLRLSLWQVPDEEEEEEGDDWVTCHVVVPLFVASPGQYLTLVGSSGKLGK